jgi:hypothetical protein
VLGGGVASGASLRWRTSTIFVALSASCVSVGLRVSPAYPCSWGRVPAVIDGRVAEAVFGPALLRHPVCPFGIRCLCWRLLPSFFSGLPSSFVSDVIDLQFGAAPFGVWQGGLAWCGLPRSPTTVCIQVQGSDSIGRRDGVLRTRARRQGAFFGDGQDEDVARLPGASQVKS